jgi:hypothetical protein
MNFRNINVILNPSLGNPVINLFVITFIPPELSGMITAISA